MTAENIEFKAPQASPSRIRDMPDHRRPRELIMDVGADKVCDEVLLAALLRTGGMKGQSVIDLTRKLLDTYKGDLLRLSEASIQELARIKGMGRVKAIEIKVACELAKRIALKARTFGTRIHSPGDVVDVLRPELFGLNQEMLWALLLNTKNQLIRKPVVITMGLLDSSLVHSREVFHEAIRQSAAAIIVAHNHPSGDTTPSLADIEVTRKLVAAGKLLEIPVLDHIIVGTHENDGDFTSIKAKGLVAFE